MTLSTDNHEDANDDHPHAAIARFDVLDLTVPMEVLLRGDRPIAITPVSQPTPVNKPRPRSLLKPPTPTPAFYTPRALAKHWGVHVDKVLRFIHTGELPAFNAASRQSKRPRYRISLDAVRDFEAAHAACPAGPRKPSSTRRTKRPDTPSVHRYF